LKFCVFTSPSLSETRRADATPVEIAVRARFREPVTPATRHRIEVRAPGYQTLTFEVDIIAGQVIPYQGALER
jgi:hypothetical protein